ncbi:hypothetical protein CCAX7_36810 [Capsulimonas corticalis]|uniref:Uncharacterized protein n=1 Tax=Capsulimonas corticalis TaxID=2219043 RepID=A0A402D1F5_9BACT|nr:hypothetical protein [Capsulimonas corticalis]BDI31630.1 hypothetical protein CCAX7_36810 [Capsulimonas corticalis]
MINFKNRDEILPSALILLSIVLMSAALLYILLVPAPTVASAERAHRLMRRRILRDTTTATLRTRSSQAAAAPRLWPGDPRSVTSAVLAQLTDNARQQGVSLTSFRPQRGQTLDGVAELRYTAQLSGSYPQVRGVLASFDAKNGKTALRSVDMSAGGAKANVVTATVGLSAYLPATETVIATVQSGGGGNG